MFAAFAEVPPEHRPAYASRDVLVEAVRGGLARARSLPADAVDLKVHTRAIVEAALELFVSATQHDHPRPRELFLAALEWIDDLVESSHLDDALTWCRRAAGLGAASYPDLPPRFHLREATTLIALGHVAQADALLRAGDERPELLSDRSLVPVLANALGTTSLHVGRASEFERLLFAGLRAFYTNLDQRLALVVRLRRASRGSLRLLARGDLRGRDRLLYLIHWLALRLPWPGAVSSLVGRVLLAGLYAANYARPPRVPAARSIPRWGAAPLLVTRAMGGIGDLLMMTPGLAALRRQHPGRVIHLAVPRRYFPLFEGNDDVELVDIEQSIDRARYGAWFNLTDCPAARVESLTAPRVRLNRIDIFAKALGVRGGALREMDRRPRYVVSPEERGWRERFLAQQGLEGARPIGVQLRADERYRDTPLMAAIVRRLAREWPVLVFDSRPITGLEGPNIVLVDRVSMRSAFSLAGACGAIVAPDSSFLHVAAALGVPSLGVFGPTDGRVRAMDYPLARFVDARTTLHCVPCWRNEDTPCALTGMRPSACLNEIDADAVVSLLRSLVSAAAKPERVLALDLVRARS